MAALGQRLDADPATRWEQPGAGKRVTLWEQAVAIEGIEGIARPVRRVLRLILRLMGPARLVRPRCAGQTQCQEAAHQDGMQELIYRAGRLIEHGRRLILGLGANDRAAKAFARVHGELFAATP